ncbi:MAG: hypothetical protein KJO31_14915 [Gammaproteobacteria bacterium]|nr:hypothetical protein [Gammaproteobacteria bacterium]
MTIFSKKRLDRSRRAIAFGLLAVATSPSLAELRQEFGGHVKSRIVGQFVPTDSVLHGLTGSASFDLENDLRINYKASSGRWGVDAAYQVFALYGDRVDYSRDLAAALSPGRLQSDDRRWLQLTSVVEDDGKFAVVHRIDRASIDYKSPNIVLRFGRQAISWGNGLFFSPLDIVNPFDPTVIDTEYKAGDDMLYGQYLFDNGDDVQAAYVVRRDLLSGDVDSSQATAAIKYHRMIGDGEIDLLVAKSFDDYTLAIGGNLGVGGAVLRGDLVVTDTEDGLEGQLVANYSYSWMWGERNISGAVEYFYNGFGQPGGAYSPAELAENPELLRRVARGDLFSLGRHYLAGSLSIEMTPLWLLVPTVFANLQDPSGFLQIISQNDLRQNLTFLGSINVPVGASGTEFGGIDSGIPGAYFSTDLSVFAQFAWYF